MVFSYLTNALKFEPLISLKLLFSVINFGWKFNSISNCSWLPLQLLIIVLKILHMEFLKFNLKIKNPEFILNNIYSFMIVHYHSIQL